MKKKQIHKKAKRNYAFIDSQNLNLGIQRLGWNLDFRKFRVYLKEKYGVDTAYVLIFKELLKYANGSVKGNCDAELVLQSMIDYKNYEKAVIISGDGDFACLVRYLSKYNKLEQVIVPDIARYSALLKKAAGKHLDSMNDLKHKLSYKKKRTP